MVQLNDEKLSKQAHAYTPGLKVKKATVVRKSRLLPLPGQVLVKRGDEVNFDTVIARSEVPGEPYIVEATNSLGLQPEELPKYMVKSVGDKVKKGESVAQWIALFGLIKKIASSPTDGIVESFSELTGRITVRGEPVSIEIKAYIPGRVVDIIPREGAVIETSAAFIQGIFGIGREKHGPLLALTKSPEEIITPDMITSESKGKIILGGSFITFEALSKAVQEKVSGIVVGGINAADLNNFLGYRMGVAITGEEELGTTLVVTEGFGKMNMSQRTFRLLSSFDGEEAAINGATQIRAGVLRPEVIIPHMRSNPDTSLVELAGGLRQGTPVRIIKIPFFGRLGVVINLPVELRKLETESQARVVKVELENGEQVVVPRANVEIIEE
nr:hypothetical protein [Candidatus Njordarchaeum guaymaensis]